EKQVSRLLEKAHRAFRAGKYPRARKLAWKALKLGPDFVAAHPLVYKMDHLKRIEEHTGKPVAGSPEIPPVPPAGEHQTSSQPFGAIDPSLTSALTEALLDTPNPLAPQLILLDGEEKKEGPEGAFLFWRPEPPPVEIPSLLFEGEDRAEGEEQEGAA